MTTPAYAARIWTDNNVLFLDLPNTLAADRASHTLKLPMNVYGMTQAVEILKARHELSTIGTKGDQTQHQADADIAKLIAGFDPDKVKKPKAKVTMTDNMRASVREIMRRVGIS